MDIIVDDSQGEKVRIELKGIQAALVLAVITMVILASNSNAGSPTLGSAADRDAPPSVGEKIRDFSLMSVDGKQLTLSDELKRGPVVLVLLRGWPGYQCPFCTRQFGDFLAHAKELQSSGARVIMVYPGPGENLKQHVDEFIANRELLPNFHNEPPPLLAAYAQSPQSCVTPPAKLVPHRVNPVEKALRLTLEF